MQAIHQPRQQLREIQHMQASCLHGDLAGGIDKYTAAQSCDTHNPFVGLINVAHGTTPMTVDCPIC